MLISPNVFVTADVKFHRLLRIEGTMEGKVIASQEVNKLVKLNYYLIGFVGLFSIVPWGMLSRTSERARLSLH